MGKSTCSIDGCENIVRCKGYCTPHYRRSLAGKPLLNPCPACKKDNTSIYKYCSTACYPKATGPQCLVEDCPRETVARGVCATHHQRMRNKGTLPDRWCRGCGNSLPEDSSPGKRYCGELCVPKVPEIPSEWKPCERCSYPIDMSITHASGRRRRSDIKMCPFCVKAKYRRHKTSLGEILARDGNACRLCGDLVNLTLSTPNPASPSVDHIVPFSLGGGHGLENLQLAHMRCNQSKNNKLPAGLEVQ